MICYTNIGTISPDNSYLVFNAEGSILGKLSSSLYPILEECDFTRRFHIQSGQCSIFASMQQHLLVTDLWFPHGQEAVSFH